MAEELEKANSFEVWMADWMDAHPAAANLEEAGDIIPAVTIMVEYFLSTGDDMFTEKDFNDCLFTSDYVFKGGGWLVKR